MKKSPNEGGCWFCHDDNLEDMCFSMEWDTNVHDKCAQEQAALNNPEALIILREWGELPESFGCGFCGTSDHFSDVHEDMGDDLSNSTEAQLDDTWRGCDSF